jgi:hypothetical protein
MLEASAVSADGCGCCWEGSRGGMGGGLLRIFVSNSDESNWFFLA